MLPLIAIAIFLVSLGVLLSGMYLFVEAPLARRKLRVRLGALEQAALRSEPGADRVRKELLGQIPALERVLMNIPGVARLDLFLQQAAIRMPAGTFVILSVGIAFSTLLVSLLAGFSAAIALMSTAGAGAVPFAVASVRRKRRLVRFEELFPDAIDLLARAVRAGHAFTSGFELIGQELADPVGEEFRTTYHQQNLGVPLRDALANLTVRVPLPDVRIFVSAIQIQRESGGNLGEILDTLSYVIRERFKLQRQVRVYTAEGRMSMYVLTALPVVAGLGMYGMNREYVMPLFTDPAGHQALAVALALQVVGYFVIRRVLRIQI